MEMASVSADRVLLLGPVQVIQNGAPLHQPPSRKVRALLAYLAWRRDLSPREKLCELFWDVADDPRSELRWCLSIRGGGTGGGCGRRKRHGPSRCCGREKSRKPPNLPFVEPSNPMLTYTRERSRF